MQAYLPGRYVMLIRLLEYINFLRKGQTYKQFVPLYAIEIKAIIVVYLSTTSLFDQIHVHLLIVLFFSIRVNNIPKTGNCVEQFGY